MAFLVDTSAIIELEREGTDLEKLVRRAGNEPVYLSAIGWAELSAGVHLADTAQRALARRKKLDGLKAQMSVLPFTSEIAEEWAEAFAELQRGGIPIPANDLAIGATALY